MATITKKAKGIYVLKAAPHVYVMSGEKRYRNSNGDTYLPWFAYDSAKGIHISIRTNRAAAVRDAVRYAEGR